MQKIDYSDYDSQNRALKAVEYGWEENQETAGQWVKRYSWERAFDGYGNLILNDRHYYSGDEISYQFRDEYAYDAVGRQTMYSYFLSLGIFAVGNKYEYDFDSNGNGILSVEYTYDSATRTFIPVSKKEATYGDRILSSAMLNGNIYLTLKQFDWDSDLEEWVIERDGLYEWQFDANDNPSSVSLSTKAGNEWIWYGTTTFYYSPHEVSGIADAPSNSLRARISGGRLHVENGVAGTVQVFDISGRQRLNTYSSGSQSLDVSHLPQGIYLVRMNGKTFKIIKN
jgi:hypothetical protein